MEIILTVKEESMTAVADAVREKSGTSGALSFPNGMVDAINSIETTTVDINVDNQTIINDGGVIRTAIGGYRTEPLPGEDLYFFNGEETGEYISLTSNEIELSSGHFRGYYAIPNWTPIGEQHSGRTFEIRIREYDQYPDTGSWTEPYSINGVFDGATNTIHLNTCGVTVDTMIDNATGYLKCQDHIFDMTDQYPDPRVGFISIRAIETNGDYIPIDARFVNVDNNTIFNNDGVLNANPLRSMVDDLQNNLQNQIDEIRNNSGGGSSLAADGQTIINDGGVIRTAIGGGMTEGEGVEYYHAGTSLYYAEEIQLPNWTPLGEEFIDKGFKISYFTSYDYYEEHEADGEMIGEWYRVDDEFYDCDYYCSFDGTTIYMCGFPGWLTGTIDNETGIMGVNYDTNFFDNGYIYDFVIYTPRQRYFSPIDANAIPVDGDTIQIADGKLVAAGVSEDRVNELINEALGVIENGSY
jgi:hypothetical protein